MPSGGLPRKVRDADGNEGTFLAQTCTGRRDHLGGGKPPSSKVHTMRYAGHVTVPEWETQEHHDVQEWGGEKETRLAESEIRESTEMAFEVYGEQLKTAPSFKCLGRILTEGDDNWPAVAGNLGKARKSWVRLQRILIS